MKIKFFVRDHHWPVTGESMTLYYIPKGTLAEIPRSCHYRRVSLFVVALVAGSVDEQ